MTTCESLKSDVGMFAADCKMFCTICNYSGDEAVPHNQMINDLGNIQVWADRWNVTPLKKTAHQRLLQGKKTLAYHILKSPLPTFPLVHLNFLASWLNKPKARMKELCVINFFGFFADEDLSINKLLCISSRAPCERTSATLVASGPRGKEQR